MKTKNLKIKKMLKKQIRFVCNNEMNSLTTLINEKAMQVSTTIFALAVATNSIFNKYFYREILLLIINYIRMFL